MIRGPLENLAETLQRIAGMVDLPPRTEATVIETIPLHSEPELDLAALEKFFRCIDCGFTTADPQTMAGHQAQRKRPQRGVPCLPNPRP